MGKIYYKSCEYIEICNKNIKRILKLPVATRTKVQVFYSYDYCKDMFGL